MKLAFDKLNQHQIIIQREIKPVMFILRTPTPQKIADSSFHLYLFRSHYMEMEWKMNYGLN